MESVLNKIIRELLESFGIKENFKLIGAIKKLIKADRIEQSKKNES